jgi:hypothetical protein
MFYQHSPANGIKVDVLQKRFYRSQTNKTKKKEFDHHSKKKKMKHFFSWPTKTTTTTTTIQGERIDLTVFVMLNDHLFPLVFLKRLTL